MAKATKPVLREKLTLNPEWLARTAKLAMKRGTALVFAKNGSVYGILPKSGGSVNVFYEADKEWTDAVLAIYPAGAVFPFDNVFGGSATAKALRAYANIKLPEDGNGTAWIDGVTGVLHVKGKGATVHSAAFSANDFPVPSVPESIPELSFTGIVTKDAGKILTDCTRRDDNRPLLKRVFGFGTDTGGMLGATDGRSAVLMGAGSLPDGFTFDPTLVNMFDIVGYVNETTESGAVIHNFRLSDGTVFVEKLSGIVPQNIPAKIEAIAERGQTTLMGSAQLRQLVEDIGEMGLGANDTWGGVLVFTSSGVEVQSNNQPVAEFEAAVHIEPGDKILFSLPVVARIAALGGDLRVTDDGAARVGYSEAGEIRVVSMPMVLVPGTGASA